jgi:hypothetical protein
MILVAVAGLILSLVAYEQGLSRRVSYHETKYWEQVTVVPPGTRKSEIYSSKLPDGTWSLPYQKTRQSEWHEQIKQQYRGAIIRTNQLLITALLISACMWITWKAVSRQLRQLRRWRKEHV